MIGSFCLFKSENKDNTKLGVDYLRNKFRYSTSYTLGSYTLILFSDSTIVDTQVYDHYMLGSLMYNGRKDEKAAQILLTENGKNWEKAYGNYVIISQRKNEIELTLDPLRKYHVFNLGMGEFISNSYLACCHAATELSINQTAFYEKLSRGYIIAPDTLFKEVRLLNTEKKISEDIFLTQNKYVGEETPLYSSRSAAIESQKNTLFSYFVENQEIFEEEGIDLGISSGYDSRLLLALIKKFEIKNARLHTHAIKDLPVHSFDRQIADQLSKLSQLSLKVVETSKFSDLRSGSLEKAMNENFLTFEGRSSHNMGALTETYTLSYKKAVLGELNISLNGLGGEIFRNYYNIPSKVSFDSFLENYLFYRFTKDLMGKKKFFELRENFLEKCNTQLGTKPSNNNKRAWIRRYYSEIRMPQGDASNHNAYNAYFRFITPFIEPSILQAGYGINKFLGTGGKFEGELIASIDQNLARIPTHYGNNAVNPGLKAVFNNNLKTILPQKIWRIKLDLQKRQKNFSLTNKLFLEHLLSESVEFRKAWNTLRELFPAIHWDTIYYEFACMANACMLAQSIHAFREKIKSNT